MLNLDIHYNDYEEEDIYLATEDRKFIARISEGTGQNLEPEDEEEGYVDYWYVEGIDDTGNEYGGGMLYLKTLIRDDNQTLKEIIDFVKENSDLLDEPELIKKLEPIDFEEGESLFEEYEATHIEHIEKVRMSLIENLYKRES